MYFNYYFLYYVILFYYFDEILIPIFKIWTGFCPKIPHLPPKMPVSAVYFRYFTPYSAL